MKKYGVLLYTLLALLLVSAAVGISYAYMTATVTINGDIKTTTLNTLNDLTVDFNTGAAFSINSALPISSSQVATSNHVGRVNFTVGNPSTNVKALEYTLSLTDVDISSNLTAANKKFFRWQLLSSDNNGSSYSTVVAFGSFDGAVTGTDINLTPTNITIASGATNYYQFNVWLNDWEELDSTKIGVDQSTDFNNTYVKGKLKVTASPVADNN